MLDMCRKKGFATELRLFDLTAKDWPYEDTKFDNAIACGIFHFFDKPDIFFKETSRVIKKGGTFSFTVMVSEENLLHYTDAGSGLSIYFHNDSQVIELLDKYGFILLKCITFFIYKEPDKKEKLMFKGYLAKKV